MASLLQPQGEDDDAFADFTQQKPSPIRIRPSYEDETKISAASTFFIKDIFKVLKYMYANDSSDARSFKIVIEPERSSGNMNARQSKGGNPLCCRFWCLDASVVFREIAATTHSIILASGTLSPLDAFQGELGVPFAVKVETSHVIDLSKQVFATAVASCGGIQFNSTYANSGQMH